MRFTVEEEKAVLSRSGFLGQGCQDVLSELRRRYAEPHRHYHVWDHVLQVLSWINHIADEGMIRTGAARDLRLAALFHDAVYDVKQGAPHNEAASVEVMRSFGIKSESAEEIIMATARHGKMAPEDLPPTIALFLDCDIAHFGELRWEIVRWNDDNVIREYEHHYTKEQVAAGRKAFLKGMIADGRRIFMSDYFGRQFETQAQRNLQWLIRESSAV